jgi:hypothetical protein
MSVGVMEDYKLRDLLVSHTLLLWLLVSHEKNCCLLWIDEVMVVELEHLKIKTRLTNEKFASVKGECEI